MAQSRKHNLDLEDTRKSKISKISDLSTSKVLADLNTNNMNNHEAKIPFSDELKVSKPTKKENAYTHVNLLKQTLPKDTIQGVLALDMDDTLLDYDESIKQKRNVFINAKEIQQLIQKANENGILVICVTSRFFNIDIIEEEKSIKTFAIETLKELNATISDIYYTNGTSKHLVLTHLAEFYSLFKHQICLVDDLPENIESCFSEGFSVIPVEKNNLSYLHHIRQFLAGKLLTDECYYEDFHNFFNTAKLQDRVVDNSYQNSEFIETHDLGHEESSFGLT